MDIYIREIDSSCISEGNPIIKQLAGALCFEELELIENSKTFWSDWLFNRIKGDKITVVAEKTDKGNKQRLVGVVRLWKTPYCGNKWLIEGLEVISTERRKGIGTNMVRYGLDILRKNGIKKVSANISNTNIPSIKLHESLGFNRVSLGSINSYGEFRDHIDKYTLILNRS